jgi:hypothetical protein
MRLETTKKAHYTQTYIAVHPAADLIPYKDPRTSIRAHNWHQKRSIMGEITHSSIESDVIQTYRHSDAYYGAGVYFVSMGLLTNTGSVKQKKGGGL